MLFLRLQQEKPSATAVFYKITRQGPDSLAQALLGLLGKQAEGWMTTTALDLAKGVTATDLLAALNDVAADKRLDKGHGWPITPKVLSSRLQRIAPDLKKVHRVTITLGRSDGKRVVRVAIP